MVKSFKNVSSNGGQVLGYEIVKKLVVIEKESKVVKEIFLLREQKLSYKAIANVLNQRGEVTRTGKPFNAIAIKQIVENPIYLGKVNYTRSRNNEGNYKRRKGEVESVNVDAGHESIISQELWNKVQGVNEVITNA